MQNSKLDKIINKLGFNPLDYSPVRSDYIKDDYLSPFHVLDVDELRFLLDYLKKNQNKKAAV